MCLSHSMLGHGHGVQKGWLLVLGQESSFSSDFLPEVVLPWDISTIPFPAGRELPSGLGISNDQSPFSQDSLLGEPQPQQE